MNDIKVGEYIRTKNGTINQIKKIVPFYENNELIFNESYVDTEDFREWKVYQLASILKKHSENIVDLIEVGDYVNGYRVVDITIAKYKPSSGVEIDCSGQSEDAYLWVDEIKSIVTHEQFNSIKYVLGGNEE